MNLEIFRKKYTYWIMNIVNDNPGIDINGIIKLINKEEDITNKIVIITIRTLELKTSKIIRVEFDPPKIINGPLGPVEYRQAHYYITQLGEKCLTYMREVASRLEELEGEE